MTRLLEPPLEKVDALPREEQDAIASKILELAREALEEDARGETRPLNDLL